MHLTHCIIKGPIPSPSPDPSSQAGTSADKAGYIHNDNSPAHDAASHMSFDYDKLNDNDVPMQSPDHLSTSYDEMHTQSQAPTLVATQKAPSPGKLPPSFSRISIYPTICVISCPRSTQSCLFHDALVHIFTHIGVYIYMCDMYASRIVVRTLYHHLGTITHPFITHFMVSPDLHDPEVLESNLLSFHIVLRRYFNCRFTCSFPELLPPSLYSPFVL